jgi:hypothetical protein
MGAHILFGACYQKADRSYFFCALFFAQWGLAAMAYFASLISPDGLRYADRIEIVRGGRMGGMLEGHAWPIRELSKRLA